MIITIIIIIIIIIMKRLNNGHHFANICFDLSSFQTLQSLNLLHMSFSTIHQDALQGTEGNLRSIVVRNCIFNGNMSFSWLHAPHVKLISMDIGQLTRKSFHGVLNLKWLKLSNLNLTTIEEHAFPNIRSLRQIIISECPLVTLSGMENLSGLSQLIVDGASIKTLQYEAIDGLCSLQSLITRKGSLKHIFPDVFHNTNNSLHSFTGNGNSNKTMSCNMHFQKTRYVLHNLTNIDFSDNAIQFIFPGVFCSFPSLSRLNLRNNIIRDLYVDSFMGPQNLDTLILDSNKITFLQQGIFSSLSTLKNLYLRGNNIKRVHSDVFDPSPLITLNDSLHGAATVKYLDLKNNHIKKIDQHAFQNLVSLKSLLVSLNHIGSLEMGTFYGLNVLEHLDISYNQITFIQDGIFTPLIMLRYLYAGHNKIKHLNQKAFLNCTQLEILNLDFNEIRELHQDLLTGLIHLEKLSLISNKIESIQPDTFKTNKRLYYINLASNRIRTIGFGTFSPIPLLNILLLQNNQIHSLTKDLLVLRYLNLVNNPIKCRCDLFWIKNMTRDGAFWNLPFCNASTKLEIYEYLDTFCCENKPGLCQPVDNHQIKPTKHIHTVIFTGSMFYVIVVVIIVLLIHRHWK